MLNLVNDIPGIKIRGRIISLMSFIGKIRIESSIFKDNNLKYNSCDIGENFEDTSLITNNDLQGIIKNKTKI